jgi:hypothetical protein
MTAIENGYIPVIDMENYKTNYSEEQPIEETKNAWEYYFNQPTVYTLKDAYTARNVILSNMNITNKIDGSFSYYNDANIISLYHENITKYMRFNDKVIQTFECQRKLLFSNRKNILGVQFRGTDYNIPRFSGGHKTMPSINVFIQKTKELFEMWNMEYIYFTSEDENVLNEFKKIFKNKLVFYQHPRVSDYNGKDYITTVQFEKGREFDKYFRGLEYIVDVLLLSECDSIICPIVNGSIAAMELKNTKYINSYFFDLGKNKQRIL